MASFYVLTPPGSKHPQQETLLVRDAFSWIGFLLPLPWLLFRRMWLIATLAILVYIAMGLAAEAWNFEGLTIAYGLIVSLWVGFEGGHLRACRLERKGWTLRDIVHAPDRATAEEIFFSSATTVETPAPKPVLPEAAPAQNPHTIMALGLIEPYGGR